MKGGSAVDGENGNGTVGRAAERGIRVVEELGRKRKKKVLPAGCATGGVEFHQPEGPLGTVIHSVFSNASQRLGAQALLWGGEHTGLDCVAHRLMTLM